jgi:hypothetical protein
MKLTFGNNGTDKMAFVNVGTITYGDKIHTIFVPRGHPEAWAQIMTHYFPDYVGDAPPYLYKAEPGGEPSEPIEPPVESRKPVDPDMPAPVSQRPPSQRPPQRTSRQSF